MNSKYQDFQTLLKFLVVYQSRKTKAAVSHVEKLKNNSVDLLMHKRGRLQKYVWHTSMVGLASIGFLSSGAISGNSMVASSFPGVVSKDTKNVETFDPTTSDSTINSLINFKTSVSDKPRSEIIEYEVKDGDTLSGIAQKFNVDTDTIKWANDLESKDAVKPGQKLKILPVSGIAHTVKSGDSLESIAKKYQADAQAIVDFPFNDVPDDFKLKPSQVLIVPDGQPPEVKVAPKSKLQPQYLAQQGNASGPSFSAPAGGSFIWPTQGLITQYFAWYHPGNDIASNAAPPIVASDGGTIIVAGWPDNGGYGNRVEIDHGNGYITRYAHLSNIYVTAGQRVAKGQVLGKMGTTGRSTGTHLHFEIHYKGIAVNPLAILK